MALASGIAGLAASVAAPRMLGLGGLPAMGASMVAGRLASSAVNAITSRPNVIRQPSLPQAPQSNSGGNTVNYTAPLNNILQSLQTITTRIETTNAHLKKLLEYNSPGLSAKENNNIINRFITNLNNSFLGKLTGRELFKDFNAEYNKMMKTFGEQLNAGNLSNFNLLMNKFLGSNSAIGKILTNGRLIDRLINTKTSEQYAREKTEFDNKSRATLSHTIPDLLTKILKSILPISQRLTKDENEQKQQTKLLNEIKMGNDAGSAKLSEELEKYNNSVKNIISVRGTLLNMLVTNLPLIGKIAGAIGMFKVGGWLANMLGIKDHLQKFGQQIWGYIQKGIHTFANSNFAKKLTDGMYSVVVRALMWYATFQKTKQMGSSILSGLGNLRKGFLHDFANEVYKTQRSLILHNRDFTEESKKMLKTFKNIKDNNPLKDTGVMGVIGQGLGKAASKIPFAKYLSGFFVKIFTGASKYIAGTFNVIGIIMMVTNMLQTVFGLAGKGASDAKIIRKIGDIAMNFVKTFFGLLKRSITFIFSWENIKAIGSIAKNIIIEVIKQIASTFGMLGRLLVGKAPKKEAEEQIHETTKWQRLQVQESQEQTSILDKIRESTESIRSKVNPKTMMMYGAQGLAKLVGFIQKGGQKLGLQMDMTKIDNTFSKLLSIGGKNLTDVYQMQRSGVNSNILSAAIIDSGKNGKSVRVTVDNISHQAQSELKENTIKPLTESLIQNRDNWSDEVKKQNFGYLTNDKDMRVFAKIMQANNIKNEDWTKFIGNSMDNVVNRKNTIALLTKKLKGTEGAKYITEFNPNEEGDAITASSTSADYERILKRAIKNSEGFRREVYKDSLGNLTVGYGHKVKPEDGLVYGQRLNNDALADKWFEENFQTAFQHINGKYSNLDYARKAALVDMAYNMGLGFDSKFKNMRYAIINSDFNRAGDEILDSDYAKQVKSRAYRNAYAMRNSKFDSNSSTYNSITASTIPNISLSEIQKYALINDGVDVEGLNPDLKYRLYNYAKDYLAKHNKKITITSGYRSDKKQAILYKRWLNHESKYPAAPPGRSMHNKRLAFDISTNSIDKELLAKNSLVQPLPAKDPIHIQALGGISGAESALYASGSSEANELAKYNFNTGDVFQDLSNIMDTLFFDPIADAKAKAKLEEQGDPIPTDNRVATAAKLLTSINQMDMNMFKASATMNKHNADKISNSMTEPIKTLGENMSNSVKEMASIALFSAGTPTNNINNFAQNNVMTETSTNATVDNSGNDNTQEFSAMNISDMALTAFKL